MKIQINNIVRDMTPTEEAEWWEWHNSTPSPDDPTAEEALDILLGGAE